MKKNCRFFISSILSILLLCFTACNTNIDTDKTAKGSARLTVGIIDYYELAETRAARVIAPQTTSVRFSYFIDSEWTVAGTANFSDLEGVDIPNTPADFPAKFYSVEFDAIPVGTYAAGKMFVELIDAQGTVVTSAYNASAVTVQKNTTADAVFYTLPYDDENQTGSLNAGEMKFWKISLNPNSSWKLIVTANGDMNPDVAVFDSNGRIVSYYAVDSTGDVVVTELAAGSSQTVYYIGVWADDGIDIGSYTLSLEENVYDLPDLTFGDGSGFAEGWQTSGSYMTPEVVLLDSGEYGVYFDFKALRTDTTTLSKDVSVPATCLLSFTIKTDIYAAYDGTFKFYIDDVLQNSYVGIGGDWNEVSFMLEPGTHTIKWSAEGVSNSYTTGITNSVYIGSVQLSLVSIPSTISEDFESGTLSDIFGLDGIEAIVSEDECLKKWAQYGDAIVDTHGKVIKLATKSETSTGNSYLRITAVNPTVDSTLSFDYKCDLYEDDYLRVYVDGEQVGASYTGGGSIWKKLSVPVSAGSHSISIGAEKTTGYYMPSYTNAVYIDNLSLIPDVTSKVDISPKGLQETYINGDTIQFKANALREDGSVRDGLEINWSCTGGSIDANGLFTPGTTSGTYTVTALIDGKSASNTTVKVHGSDYKSDSVVIAGHEYTGAISNLSGSIHDTETITFAEPTPAGNTFDADGFFVLAGTVNRTDSYGNYAYVKVTKDSYVTTYYVKDTFCDRIWLRFGPGTYKVLVSDATVNVRDTGDPRYEGDFNGCSYYTTDGNYAVEFTVNNVADDGYSADEAAYLLPSFVCQSDDYTVSNVVNAVMAELPADATDGQKLQALHDWEIHHLYYDNVSLNHGSLRKRQDAVHNIKYGTCVCEGYANLYAAFARSVGIQVRYVSSTPMNHGWVHVLYNGEWKLVDATWDDPVSSNSDSYCDVAPDAENYKYFLIALSGVGGDHYSYQSETSRSAVGIIVPPKMFGLPDGWY